MAEAAKVQTVSQADFGEIVRENQSMVFSIAYHHLRDRAIAEEIAQDAFLQLHKSIATLESPEHVTFWLRRVVTNRCIDHCRRRRLMPRIGLEQIPEPSTFDRARDPLLSRTLRQLVGSLPEKWRALVILRYQEEMDNEEIAKVLNMPVGTVKSQLSRAIDLLREKASRVLGEG